MNKLTVIIFVLGVTALIASYIFNKNDVLITANVNSSSQFEEENNSNTLSTSSAAKVISFNANKKVKTENMPEKEISDNKTLIAPEKNSIAENKSTNNLHLALSRVPDTYHNIFQWSGGIDNEIIDEYANAFINQENQPHDVNVEQQFSNFVYQHELSAQISIELLRCTSLSCEVYGTEFRSNIWGVIKTEIKQTPWWPFSKDITRSGVGKNGEMVFLTITRR